MKNVFKVVFALSVSILLVACAKAVPKGNEGTGADKPVSKPANQGITVNKISFEEVKEENIPEALKVKINNLKVNRGYFFEQKDGSFYVAVLAGQKPTGGYGIKVKAVEDNEGKTNILVEEIAPKPDQIVTQALTYPYTVVKMKGVTDNFNIKNEKGESFSPVKNGAAN